MPPFDQLGIWTACLLLTLDVYLRWRGPRPPSDIPKREIILSETYATKQELTAIRATAAESSRDQIEGRRQIHAKIEALRLEIKDDIGGVHERITSVFGEVKQLIGEIRAGQH